MPIALVRLYMYELTIGLMEKRVLPWFSGDFYVQTITWFAKVLIDFMHSLHYPLNVALHTWRMKNRLKKYQLSFE